MKNKIIGFSLIIFSICYLINFIYDDVGSIIYQNNIINKNFINNGNTTEYLGYIEIKKLGLKKLIKTGTEPDILDELYVGYVENSSLLDSIKGNTILAGHNTYSVFSKLQKLEVDDEIIINSLIKRYKFKVVLKYIIDSKDKQYFKKNEDLKLLTLITCTKEKNKRLIIIAKKV